MRDQLRRIVAISLSAVSFHAVCFSQCMETADDKTKVGEVRLALSCWKTNARSLQNSLDLAATTAQKLQTQLDASNAQIANLNQRLEGSKSATQSTQEQAQRDLDRLRSDYNETKSKLDSLRSQTEKASMLSGGADFHATGSFQNENLAFLKSIEANVKVADGKLNLTGLEVQVDESHAKFPLMGDSKKFKMSVWLVAWNSVSKKWDSTKSQHICCWDFKNQLLTLTSTDPIALELVPGYSIGQQQLTVGIAKEEETGSINGAVSGELQAVATQR